MSDLLNPYFEVPYRSGDVLHVKRVGQAWVAMGADEPLTFHFDEATVFGIVGGWTSATDGVLIPWHAIDELRLVPGNVKRHGDFGGVA